MACNELLPAERGCCLHVTDLHYLIVEEVRATLLKENFCMIIGYIVEGFSGKVLLGRL